MRLLFTICASIGLQVGTEIFLCNLKFLLWKQGRRRGKRGATSSQQSRIPLCPASPLLLLLFSNLKQNLETGNLITDRRKQSFERPFRCKDIIVKFFWFLDKGLCVILSTLDYHHQTWMFNVNIYCLQKPDKLRPRRGLFLCQVKRLANCFARERRNIGHFVPELSSVSSQS